MTSVIVASVIAMHDVIEMLRESSMLLCSVLSHTIILTYHTLHYSTALYSVVVYVVLLVV